MFGAVQKLVQDAAWQDTRKEQSEYGDLAKLGASQACLRTYPHSSILQQPREQLMDRSSSYYEKRQDSTLATRIENGMALHES